MAVHQHIGGPASSSDDRISDGGAPVDLDLEVDLRPLDRPTVRDRLDDARSELIERPGRLAVTVAVTIACLFVGWWLLRPPAVPPIEELLPRADGSSAAADAPPAGSDAAEPPETVAGAGSDASDTTDAGEVIVQAAGAVARPGVYRLPAGARVDDLVRSAGGMAPDADGDRVNLAAPVSDGERVWFPRRGEEEVPELVAGSGGAPGASTGQVGEGGGGGQVVVDLNSSSAAELEALPGVGPATAAAIVSHREQHGPFASVDQLLEVRGIGDAKLEQIRPSATVR